MKVMSGLETPSSQDGVLPSGKGDSKTVLEELRGELRRLEGGYGDPGWRRHVPTGLGTLDAVLPGGGLPAGALVEIQGPNWPPWTVALLVARGILGSAAEAEAIIVDSERDLYPPALAGFGLDAARTAIVWPRNEREAGWAFSEALDPRGLPDQKGCAIAIAALRGSSLADRRRLQLAAESGGGIGILLCVARTATGCRGEVAGGAVRLRVQPSSSANEIERFSVEVIRCRGGPAGGRALVEVDRAAVFDARTSLF